MKVLVTGVNGQLGHDVMLHLQMQGIEGVGVDIQDFDLTDEEAVMNYVNKVQPSAIIHCAAYTAVDKAEGDQARCCRINGEGTLNMVRAAISVKAKMMYISTDYVFPGEGEKVYEPMDPKGPQNIYGLSKLQGEMAVASQMTAYFIVRTSWVYGVNGHNFVRTMLRLGAERDSVNVVCDQIGSPTFSYDLARCLVDLIQTTKHGVYHATNEGFCSWAEFAQAIMDKAGLSCKVHPVLTSQYKTAAKRPLNSRMSKDCLDKAGVARLPQWEDALQRYLEEIL